MSTKKKMGRPLIDKAVKPIYSIRLDPTLAKKLKAAPGSARRVEKLLQENLRELTQVD